MPGNSFHPLQTWVTMRRHSRRFLIRAGQEVVVYLRQADRHMCTDVFKRSNNNSKGSRVHTKEVKSSWAAHTHQRGSPAFLPPHNQTPTNSPSHLRKTWASNSIQSLISSKHSKPAGRSAISHPNDQTANIPLRGTKMGVFIKNLSLWQLESAPFLNREQWTIYLSTTSIMETGW